MELQRSEEFRRAFDPTAYDLESSFEQAGFADLKERGCKVLQEALGKFLAALQEDHCQ